MAAEGKKERAVNIWSVKVFLLTVLPLVLSADGLRERGRSLLEKSEEERNRRCLSAVRLQRPVSKKIHSKIMAER